jgi:hypothetical protein
MRIQFLSDVHLESWRGQTFDDILDPVAPILALLGDVAPLTNPILPRFFEWCSERFETILWVPGNLEIWESGGYDSSLERMKTFASTFANVIVMDKEGMYSDDGVVILGCPLWYRPHEDVMLHYAGKVWIKPEPLPCHGGLLLKLHTDHVRWLGNKIRDLHVPIVILSYYAPLLAFVEEEWVQDPENSLHSPDLENLLRPPVVAWIFGHCHRKVEYNYSWSGTTGQETSVLLTNNPRGYPDEVTGFRRDAVLRVDPNQYSQSVLMRGPISSDTLEEQFHQGSFKTGY